MRLPFFVPAFTGLDRCQGKAVAEQTHEQYRKRRGQRAGLSFFAFMLLCVFVVERLLRSNLPGVVQFVVFIAGCGLIWFVNWIDEQQNPDPDPKLTQEIRDASARRRAKKARIKAENRAAEQIVQAKKKAASERKRVEVERERAAAAEAERMRSEQDRQQAMQQQREQMVSQLLQLRTTQPEIANKVAAAHGIDLEVEAGARLIAGMAILGVAVGAGAVAGAEAMRAIIDKTKQKTNPTNDKQL